MADLYGATEMYGGKRGHTELMVSPGRVKK